jgi:biofilm PGA synthesis lipoprotein PgaB
MEVLMIRLITSLVMIFFFTLTGLVLACDMQDGEFLVLTYHAVPFRVSPTDEYSVSQNRFVEQMEYLRTHGYNPVSLDDILRAHEGKQKLPKSPVLITFDDAYISYYEFVVPILERFGYPSVLSVVGSFIDNPPKGLPESLMNWDQIKEVASKRLVEVVSHTYNLHKGIQYNPQGNVGPAVTVRAYDPGTKSYETEGEYIARIEADFKTENALFTRQLGFVPRGIIWPYGRYNSIGIEAALKAGYRFCFTEEEGLAHIGCLQEINRIIINNEPINDFIKKVEKPKPDKRMIRAVQVDLDMIYDPTSYDKTDENLGKLIDRLVAMKVNTVFLQAFADPEGTGNIKSVYFHNRVLPVRADIFSHAVHQMIIRDMSVYAWLPTLSIVLPDRKLNEELRVREIVNGGKTRPSQSWYERLTPFSADVRRLVRQMYEDLAAHSLIHGILFQDDAYLTDREDFHPLALSAFKNRFGKDLDPRDLVRDRELSRKWARYKTEVLIDFTSNIMKGVRKYLPNAFFARNLYAEVLVDPASEDWFAQNYDRFLQTYDEVVIMAYPQLEKIRKPSPWLKRLVLITKGFPKGIEKTVFKVQSYDWQKKTWLNDNVILEELRDILASGGKHIAYYPDDLWIDRPKLGVIKLEMSTNTYPFMR